MKIGLIVGHTGSAKGAVSYNGISEYTYNTVVANDCKKELEGNYVCEVVVFTRNAGYDFINQHIKNFDLSIELHFNSFNKPAFGIEMLVLEESGPECIRIADIITDILATNYNMKERANDGVKCLSRYERGTWCLHSVKNVKNKMLIEPCFANFKTKDSEQFFELGCDLIYATRLASAIATACKLQVKDPTLSENEPTLSENKQKLALIRQKLLDIIELI